MKKIIRIAMAAIAALAILSPMSAGAQRKDTEKRKVKVQKPDLNAIKDSTLNPQSRYYFPTLMEKYSKKDTKMEPLEYRYLYLGYMFQEDYDPYRTSDYSSKTDNLAEKTSYTPEERRTIWKNCERALEDNPFDLRQMAFLVKILKEEGKDILADMWEYRLENILGAILSTGNGQDKDNAYYVITPIHEYDVIKFLGYDAVDVKFPAPGYDYLEVVPDANNKKAGNKVKGFYFNVVVPSEQYELKYPDEAEEGDVVVDTANEAALEE